MPNHSSTSLQALLRQTELWRASEHALRAPNPDAHSPGLPTGYAALDASLPWGGWPANALVEIMTPLWGNGELQLVLPLLRRISQAGLPALWIAPPCIPYAPALAAAGVDIAQMIIVTPTAQDVLWSMEKSLQNPASSLVLGWPARLNSKHLRRLQLAAVTGGTLGILFHQRNIAHSASVLRLSAHAEQDMLAVTVLKARGSHQQTRVLLPRQWP